jgi:hypothetical protein
MDAATFQASSTPIDQWTTGEVVTFQTPEGNMSADQYNTRLAELKGTQFQPISHMTTPTTPDTWTPEQEGLLRQGYEGGSGGSRVQPQLSGGEQVWQDFKNLFPGQTPVDSTPVDSIEAAQDRWGYGKKLIQTSDGKYKLAPGELTTGKAPWYRSKEFLGTVAAGAIPAGLAYALSDDPDDDPEDEVKKLSSTDPRRIAYDQWVLLDDKNSPEALALRDTWYGKPRYSLPDLQSRFGATQLGAPRGIAQVARGGEVVGRGTGSSDSIPARLSDGEFVMTADAVRNAGNGDRNLGAARMYDMMSRFERMG